MFEDKLFVSLVAKKSVMVKQLDKFGRTGFNGTVLYQGEQQRAPGIVVLQENRHPRQGNLFVTLCKPLLLIIVSFSQYIIETNSNARVVYNIFYANLFCLNAISVVNVCQKSPCDLTALCVPHGPANRTCLCPDTYTASNSSSIVVSIRNEVHL